MGANGKNGGAERKKWSRLRSKERRTSRMGDAHE
jgi:hypothetical protein